MQCDFLPETENRNTEKQKQIMSKNIMCIFQPAKVNPFSGPIDNFAWFFQQQRWGRENI